VRGWDVGFGFGFVFGILVVNICLCSLFLVAELPDFA
jgi:hypothetical protein